MIEDLFQWDARRRTDFQTALDQIAAIGGDASAKGDVGVADLFVRFERNVAAHHVVEQDAEAPNGGRGSVVAMEAYPFRWGIDASA